MDARKTEERSWLPRGTIDVSNEAEVRAWAGRLRVTAAELREMIEEDGDHIPRPRAPETPASAADRDSPQPDATSGLRPAP